MVVTLILVVMGPLGAALDIHHLLAEADCDGHEHSETDLCQWVQHHTGGSLSSDPPPVGAVLLPGTHRFPEPPPLFTTRLCKAGRPRAPPAR